MKERRKSKRKDMQIAEEHLSGKGKGKSLSRGWIVWGVRETTGFSDQSVG